MKGTEVSNQMEQQVSRKSLLRRAALVVGIGAAGALAAPPVASAAEKTGQYAGNGTTMSFRLGRRLRLVALVAVVLGVAAGGIAYAAIPDSNGVIHGCYAKMNGALRVIDSSSQNCDTKKEVALNWNQTGPKGPTGAKGATGATGATGPRGPTGPGSGGASVKTIGGRVAGDGTVMLGTGFSVSHYAPGGYTISFPAGTWSGCPVATVTPNDSSGVVYPGTSTYVCGSNGSGSINVHMWGDNLYGAFEGFDVQFDFIAVQS